MKIFADFLSLEIDLDLKNYSGEEYEKALEFNKSLEYSRSLILAIINKCP